MIFNAKYFIIFAFIIINFSTIFLVKTRTSVIVSLIISHLIFILFLTSIVKNFNLLLQIVVAMTVYLMTLLFLISNYNNIKLKSQVKSKDNSRINSTIIAIAIVFFVILSAFVFELSYNNQEAVKIIGQKIPAKLQDNFLIKESSKIIIIIASCGSLILLFLSKKKKKES